MGAPVSVQLPFPSAVVWTMLWQVRQVTPASARGSVGATSASSAPSTIIAMSWQPPQNRLAPLPRSLRSRSTESR
jgi:hypothetical protein